MDRFWLIVVFVFWEGFSFWSLCVVVCCFRFFESIDRVLVERFRILFVSRGSVREGKLFCRFSGYRVIG